MSYNSWSENDYWVTISLESNIGSSSADLRQLITATNRDVAIAKAVRKIEGYFDYDISDVEVETVY